MENISMETLLKSLRDHYQKGEFDSVKDLLLQNKAGFHKGEFHYNLGTVYSKMGNYAVGRYHLEKAVHEGYETVAAKHNLKTVQTNLSVHDVTTSKTYDDVLLSKGLEYGIDFYVFATLLILVISTVLFSKKLIGRWGFGLLVIVSLAPVSTHQLYLKKLNVGVNFKELQVYEGPSGIFEKTGEIPSGAKLVLGKAIDGWFFVERPLDYVGWVKSENLGILK